MGRDLTGDGLGRFYAIANGRAAQVVADKRQAWKLAAQLFESVQTLAVAHIILRQSAAVDLRVGKDRGSTDLEQRGYFTMNQGGQFLLGQDRNARVRGATDEAG